MQYTTADYNNIRFKSEAFRAGYRTARALCIQGVKCNPSIGDLQAWETGSNRQDFIKGWRKAMSKPKPH